MALSVQDQRYLTPQQQDQIRNLTEMWNQAKTDEQRTSINVTANAIRQAAGYTGGTSGADFQVTDESLFGKNQAVTPVVDQGPEAPFIDPDNFSMRNIIQPIFDLANQGPPSLDDVMGSDYFKRMESSILARAGKTAETVEQRIVDQMVSRGMLSSSMTTEQISSAVADVFASAQTDITNLIPDLQKQQMELQENQIKNLLKVSDLALTEFQYRLDLTDREAKEAMERTKLRGYVDNEDAIILGVPPNTPSEEARKRAADIEDYLEKQRIQLSFAKQEIAFRRESDIEKAAAIQDIKDEGSGDEGKVTEADYKDVLQYTKGFNEMVGSDRYSLLNEGQKAEEIQNQLQVYEDLFDSDALSEYAYKQVLRTIQTTPEYKKDYVGYVEKMESFEALYPSNVIKR